MKIFEQLTKSQKQDAIDFAANELMGHISNGTIEVTLVNTASQARLEKILGDARKKESSRLAMLNLLHDKPIREEIYRLALVVASESDYSDDGNVIMEGKENVDSVLN